MIFLACFLNLATIGALVDGRQSLGVDLLARFKSTSGEFREIQITALLTNGMRETSLRSPEEKHPRV